MTSYYHNHTRIAGLFPGHIYKKLIFPIAALILLLSVSCEEEASLIGGKLFPGSDFVTIKSGLLKTRSYTMYSDSVESQMPVISFLGEKSDPYFGRTAAKFVTQLRLAPGFDSTYHKVDSLKLFMRFLYVEGDTADNHYLRLSEIADQIYDTVKYYSGQSVAFTPFTIPDILLPPLRENQENFIAVHLDSLFGVHLIRNKKMMFHASDTPDFRSWFKGLHFEIISPDDPIFASLSIAPAGGSYSNYIEIYLRNDLDQKLTYKFLIDAATSNAGFNLFEHFHNEGEPGKRLEHINDLTYIDTLSYAQSLDGVYTKLLLTNLDSIKRDPAMKGISVNKARLKIPVVYDNDVYKRSTIPGRIFLRYYTKSGEKFLVPESSSFFDGTPDTTAVSKINDVYNLNIASFVQQYLDDKSDKILPVLDLFLYSTASNNVILRANNNNHPVKFEFTYTKF